MSVTFIQKACLILINPDNADNFGNCLFGDPTIIINYFPLCINSFLSIIIPTHFGRSESDSGMLYLNFSIVWITLCENANAISEPQFIAKMQEMSNKSKSRCIHVHDISRIQKTLFLVYVQTCYM